MRTTVDLPPAVRKRATEVAAARQRLLLLGLGAAVLLVALSAVRSPWMGVGYILAFGVGSIVGMVVVGLAISLPLVLASSLGRNTQSAVQGFASVASLGLGLTMILRAGFGGGLF